MPMFCNLKVQVVSSCTERNPIGRRTQPDQTANATRSDGGRSDWIPSAARNISYYYTL